MHFASQFRAATNLRPHEFVLRRRVQRAGELLQNTTTPIVEIALAMGFQTQAHFTTIFKRFVGCEIRVETGERSDCEVEIMGFLHQPCQLLFCTFFRNHDFVNEVGSDHVAQAVDLCKHLLR